MPAIMIRPAVGSSEKVSGRISATPATGPSPGNTPIAVPANAPTKAASRLGGVAAMERPYSRPCSEFISRQNSHCLNTPAGICTFRSRTKNHSKMTAITTA